MMRGSFQQPKAFSPCWRVSLDGHSRNISTLPLSLQPNTLRFCAVEGRRPRPSVVKMDVLIGLLYCKVGSAPIWDVSCKLRKSDSTANRFGWVLVCFQVACSSCRDIASRQLFTSAPTHAERRGALGSCAESAPGSYTQGDSFIAHTPQGL